MLFIALDSSPNPSPTRMTQANTPAMLGASATPMAPAANTAALAAISGPGRARRVSAAQPRTPTSARNGWTDAGSPEVNASTPKTRRNAGAAGP
jgi:hypothetical protein